MPDHERSIRYEYKVVMISRRAFLHSALVGGSIVAAGVTRRDLQPDGPTGEFKLEEVSVPIDGLPPAFQGYTIGFLTDLHLGVWVPEEWILRGIDELSKRKVDLLILGGDYILVNEVSLWQELGIVRSEKFSTMSKREAIPAIYSTITELFSGRRFPDGIYGVVGNHDHWNAFPVFQQIMRQQRDLSILINEEVQITRGEQRLYVFGVDDYLTGLPSAPPSQPMVPGVSARIIVSHNPDYIAALLHQPQHSFALAMCGHTHGGQIVLPGLGPIAAQVVDRRFVSGMHSIENGSVYTSRGLGVVGLPFRVNCPAEVTVFTLVGT